MIPSSRTLPVVVARWSDIRRAWLVALPGNVEIPVRFADQVEPLVARHAPGSSVRYVNPNAR